MLLRSVSLVLLPLTFECKSNIETNNLLSTFILGDTICSSILEVDLLGHVDLAVLLSLVPQTVFGHSNPGVITRPVSRLVITLVIVLLGGKLHGDLGGKGPQVSSRLIKYL